MNSNSKVREYLFTFVTAVLAGIAIGIGGIVFLSLEDKVVGALMFTVGLYSICAHGLSLFTGKVGYLVNEKPPYLITLLIIWLGNLSGTWLAAQAALASRISGIAEKAASMCETKANDSFISLFLLAIFCGMLMYIAVDGYKKVKNPIILFICVAGFILCGFEHCIADMFYFSVAGAWSADILLRTVVITLGNAVGGILIPLAMKLKAAE